MGVGDYVHSKEAGSHSTANDAPNQSRQALAAQARVEIPATKLVAPVPMGMNGRAQLDAYGGVTFPQPSQAMHENPMHRDMFDTDVEGVDDSTVAELSVVDVEEVTPQHHQLPPPPSAQYQEPEPKALYQLRHGRRTHTSSWYENLGEKAMKTAGFDSDDADDDASQITSVAGDGRADENNDWYLSHKHRHVEEPLSKRLEGFWSASRRSYSKPSNQPQREASKIPALGGSNGNRKIVLPRSMTATPRTRFSPPKPSLLDKLEISPTRHTNGPRAQPGKKNSPTGFTHDPEDDGRLFANDHGRRDSEPSISAFDMTNFDDLDDDDDDTIRDPFSRRASVKRISLDTTQIKKRVLEPDYPPEILAKKPFDELQAEPFDFDPVSARTTANLNPSQDSSALDEDRVSRLLGLSEKDRQTYLSNLTMDEWEDCGDQLIEQFTKLLTDMKNLRRARRKTAALFEAEVKRRHEAVQDQSADLARKLNEMRTGGVEVLRGRNP